jgi:hypothetical protein
MKIDYLTWEKVAVEYEEAPPQGAKKLELDHMVVEFLPPEDVFLAYRRATKKRLTHLRLRYTRGIKVGMDLLFINPRLISMGAAGMVWEAVWWSANFGASRFTRKIKARITCAF